LQPDIVWLFPADPVERLRRTRQQLAGVAGTGLIDALTLSGLLRTSHLSAIGALLAIHELPSDLSAIGALFGWQFFFRIEVLGIPLIIFRKNPFHKCN